MARITACTAGDKGISTTPSCTKHHFEHLPHMAKSVTVPQEAPVRIKY